MKLKKVLAAVMAITISMGTVGVRAADYGQDIDDKKSKIEETRDKIDKIKDLVDENQRELDSKSDAIAKIEIEKIEKMTTEQETAEELKFLRDGINGLDEEIEKLQAEHDELESKFLDRSRVMYQSSKKFDIISLLFESKSLFDFIDKIDFYKKMLEEDNDMLEKLQINEQELATKKKQQEDLSGRKEQLLKELDAAIEALESEEKVQKESYDELAAYLEELESEENSYYNEIDDLSYELNELLQKQKEAEEALRKAEEERKRKEEEARKASEAERAKKEAEARAAAEKENKARKAAEEANKELSEAEEKAGESGNISRDNSSAGFCWPLESYTMMTSKFGYRIHPINHTYSLHTGIDLAASSGTKIYAAQSGKVVKAEYYGGFGNCVIIDHGNGLRTLYGHCSSLNVSYGQTVKRGQLIAKVGRTGAATGNHLHFEVQLYGEPVQPLNYISLP